jgi:hypothetical protein
MSENWRAADKDVEHPRCRDLPMLVPLPPPPVAVVVGKNVFGLPQRFVSAAFGSSCTSRSPELLAWRSRLILRGILDAGRLRIKKRRG